MTAQGDLLSIEPSLSPRFRWFAKHRVKVEQGLDEDGEVVFRATMPRPPFTRERPTEDEAIAALARAASIPLWNEEEFINKSRP